MHIQTQTDDLIDHLERAIRRNDKIYFEMKCYLEKEIRDFLEIGGWAEGNMPRLKDIECPDMYRIAWGIRELESALDHLCTLYDAENQE